MAYLGSDMSYMSGVAGNCCLQGCPGDCGGQCGLAGWGANTWDFMAGYMGDDGSTDDSSDCVDCYDDSGGGGDGGVDVTDTSGTAPYDPSSVGTDLTTDPTAGVQYPDLTQQPLITGTDYTTIQDTLAPEDPGSSGTTDYTYADINSDTALLQATGQAGYGGTSSLSQGAGSGGGSGSTIPQLSKPNPNQLPSSGTLTPNPGTQKPASYAGIQGLNTNSILIVLGIGALFMLSSGGRRRG